MTKQNPFDTLATEYEAWFVDKKGVKIGIGSGFFAEQLGIRLKVPGKAVLL